MPRIRKKTSKRVATHQRERIKKKTVESKRKAKKAAKKNPQWKSKHPKDPGIPNSFPYKAEILAELAAQRRQEEEEKQRRKEQKKAERAAAKAKSQIVDNDKEDEEEDDTRAEEGEDETPRFDAVSSLPSTSAVKVTPSDSASASTSASASSVPQALHKKVAFAPHPAGTKQARMQNKSQSKRRVQTQSENAAAKVKKQRR